jgi:hypothetical protein
MGAFTDGNREAAREIMLKDLEVIEESIRHNEDTGEKRFNFFITAVTAVVAGLVALWTQDYADHQVPPHVGQVTKLAIFAMLAFGLISFRRMMHRDGVTDKYKRITHYIRRRYRDAFKEDVRALADYEVVEMLEPPKGRSEIEKRARRILQGGYTPLLGLMNGILLTAALRIGFNLDIEPAIGGGVALTLVLWVIGSAPHHRK